MKTLGVMQVIALVGEVLACGLIFKGVAVGIGFVATGGDLWIAWGLLGFSLGLLYGALRLKKKMARIIKELYPDSMRPGTLGDCKWVSGKDGNWILWYEYDGIADALTDCKR